MDDLVEFAMSRISTDIHHLKKSNYKKMTMEWEKLSERPWVVDFCDDHGDCLSQSNRYNFFCLV